MSFQISALPYATFADLFAMDDAALAALRSRRLIAGPGSPCRVSLVDAEPGETVILTNFVHQPAYSPFRASHAIFVREGAEQAIPPRDAIPPALASRILSLRAFDDDGEIVTAQLAEGAAAAPAIDALLADSNVAYLHAHYAIYGCYAARIDRA